MKQFNIGDRVRVLGEYWVPPQHGGSRIGVVYNIVHLLGNSYYSVEFWNDVHGRVNYTAGALVLEERRKPTMEPENIENV